MQSGPDFLPKYIMKVIFLLLLLAMLTRAAPPPPRNPFLRRSHFHHAFRRGPRQVANDFYSASSGQRDAPDAAQAGIGTGLPLRQVLAEETSRQRLASGQGLVPADGATQLPSNVAVDPAASPVQRGDDLTGGQAARVESDRAIKSTRGGAAEYDFGWQVKDDATANDFGHKESRSGDVTTGEYHVLLPDGRRQRVTYTVDGDSGYHAIVTYEEAARQEQTSQDQAPRAFQPRPPQGLQPQVNQPFQPTTASEVVQSQLDRANPGQRDRAFHRPEQPNQAFQSGPLTDRFEIVPDQSFRRQPNPGFQQFDSSQSFTSGTVQGFQPQPNQAFQRQSYSPGNSGQIGPRPSYLPQGEPSVRRYSYRPAPTITDQTEDRSDPETSAADESLVPVDEANDAEEDADIEAQGADQAQEAKRPLITRRVYFKYF